jgi:hypothetical protein
MLHDVFLLFATFEKLKNMVLTSYTADAFYVDMARAKVYPLLWTQRINAW